MQVNTGNFLKDLNAGQVSITMVMSDDYLKRFCPSRQIYFLSHSVGRPLKTMRSYLDQHFMEPWIQGHPWEAWLREVNTFCTRLGELYNADPMLFCPQVNLSSALTKIIHSFNFLSAKPVILCSESAFPSIGFVLEKAESAGYRLRFIPEKEDHTDTEVWKKYLSHDVRFAIMTHVHSNTGHCIPLRSILSMAREKDILSIVDVAQSAGIIPVDFAEIEPDIVIGSCVKWLCGGPGAGFLWMSSALVEEARPVDVGWFSHETPFEFDIHHFSYSKSALRFMGGTPSVAPFVIAAQAIQQITGTGVATIKDHNRRLSKKVINAIDHEKYLVTPIQDDRRGGTLVLNFGERQKQVKRVLNEAGFSFDERCQGIRVSFHIYNTEREVDALLDCLKTAGVMG